MLNTILKIIGVIVISMVWIALYKIVSFQVAILLALATIHMELATRNQSEYEDKATL